jgi:hypothetical protein
VRGLYIGKSHKKIQALSVNFDGISDIGPKGKLKSEKIPQKWNIFHLSLEAYFCEKLIFP